MGDGPEGQRHALAYHEHAFTGASPGLTLATGEKLVAWVLLSPCDPPQEVMLQWFDGSWGHRAYWGANLINYGAHGTASRQPMGDLPPLGVWTRLEVPASLVGLEGQTVTGISFTLYGGKAWYDWVGKAPATSGTLEEETPAMMMSSTAAASESPQLNRRQRVWRWVKRVVFRRRSPAPEPEPVGLTVTAQFTGVTAGAGTSRRYSFYTPELQLLAETNVTTGTPAIAYEYLWFAGEPVAQIETATGAVKWTFNDHLGTPIVQTNAAAEVVWRVEREPYGRAHSMRAGSDQHQPLAFPGQEEEQLGSSAIPSSDRFYNIFRWYRSSWGRYTQADPLLIGTAQLTVGHFDGAAATALYQWQPQHQNGYGYGLSNPLRYVDATGELSLACAHQQVPAAMAKTLQYAVTRSFPGGTKGLHNGPADAFRHCYWSCLMTQNCGWDTAYAAGTGHEIYDTNAKRRWFPNDPAESAMDLANNHEGRKCGGRCGGGGCDTCCLQKLYSGELMDKLPW